MISDQNDSATTISMPTPARLRTLMRYDGA
jgi:hypothetical protein